MQGVERGVAGLINLPHAAFTQTARDLKHPEAAAHVQRHVEGKSILGGRLPAREGPREPDVQVIWGDMDVGQGRVVVAYSCRYRPVGTRSSRMWTTASGSRATPRSRRGPVVALNRRLDLADYCLRFRQTDVRTGPPMAPKQAATNEIAQIEPAGNAALLERSALQATIRVDNRPPHVGRRRVVPA